MALSFMLFVVCFDEVAFVLACRDLAIAQLSS